MFYSIFWALNPYVSTNKNLLNQVKYKTSFTTFVVLLRNFTIHIFLFKKRLSWNKSYNTMTLMSLKISIVKCRLLLMNYVKN